MIMTRAAEKLKAEILRLAESDRAELAQLLIESLDAEVDADAEAAWDAELDRRVQRQEEGKSKSRPAEDVLDEIRKKYK
jgi:putative addiction module component (TIGR02574 family)